MQITEEDVLNWTRSFCASMELHQGTCSLLDHLENATQEQVNPQFRVILDEVRAIGSQGNSLSHALSQYPDVFSEAYLITVRYGEIYGEVDVVLHRYFEHPEDRATRCRLPE